MTHVPGRETGRLSPATLSQYKVRLKKLWRIYPHLTDEKEKELCMMEMLKLSDKTGLELGGPTLMRGPGRPRERFAIGEEHQTILEKEEAEKWTNRVQDAEKLGKSERELREMQIMLRHGVTPERLAAVKAAQKESSNVAKAAELAQAIEDKQKARARELDRPLNHDEEALIANEVTWAFTQRANEELAERIEREKDHPTGS